MSDFNVGDLIAWFTPDNNYVKARIKKIYATTFGSKVKDTALQIELLEERKGRKITTVRAKHCYILQKFKQESDNNEC